MLEGGGSNRSDLMNLVNASAAFAVRELGGARREWNGTIEGRGWARGFSN